jgi:hypothetical protein
MAPSSTSPRCSDDDFDLEPGRASRDRSTHDTILEALSDIKTVGSFAAAGSLFPVGPVDPGFNVKGVGDVELPLNEEAAASLIKLSRRAPHGHGDQTKVNTEVRKTWEIDAAEICFRPAWDGYLHEACKNVKLQMGLGPDLD